MFKFRNCAAAVMPVLLIWACGNSDSWLSRQWHNTNAHYNIYFNAEQKWQQTVLALREAHKDDYRSYILLYNYGTAESLKGNQGVMDEVVKKASTLIDKHPKSRWVDDAYLLIGKAYFMKGDFIAASDIFEFVNSSFKDPKIQYSARLWIFQSLLFQGKLEEAENLAVSLKNDKKFPPSLLPELNKALGAIYLKNKKPGQAAPFLEQSLAHMKGKMEKYRLHFALAQSYQQLTKYDSAVTHYAKVVKMNPPYDMAFNARVNQVEILSLQKKDYARANLLLRRMLKDDKNIEFYGQIYYRLGRNELRAKNDIKGLTYLNQSVRQSSNDRAQATTTYLALGDYYYEHRDFERSGLYYDSANNFLDENHPDYASISKKSLLLSDLLRHLITIKKQDSLLRLAMDPVLREKTIDHLIELEKKQALNPNAPKDNPPGPVIPQNGTNTGTQSMGSFPFYNQTSRTRGMQEFQKNWGNRTNRDYWRINSKKSAASSGSTAPDLDSTEKSDTSLKGVSADRKKYYREIPMTAESQAQALTKIEEALFAVAGVYQNSLGDRKQAVFYYKELLRRFPDTKYEAQVYYELAKMAKADGNLQDYEKYKNNLVTEFPESIYLKLLDNPNAVKTDNGDGPGSERREIEEIYDKMYKAYLSESYDAAMEIKHEADKKFAGNNLQVTFDYLYALCQIKKGQTKEGLATLKQVTEDYPGTSAALRAQETMDAYDRLQRGASDTSALDTSTVTGLWKAWDGKEDLFFLLVYQRGANSNLLRAGLNDFNKENFVFEALEVSAVTTAGNTVYLSVSNFSKPEIAQSYVKFLTEKPDFFASRGLFEYDLAWISKTNFQALAGNNRIVSYIDYYKTKK